MGWLTLEGRLRAARRRLAEEAVAPRRAMPLRWRARRRRDRLLAMAAVVATAFDQHPATMEHLALLLAHRHRHAFERTFGPDAVRVLEAAVRRMGPGWVSEWTLDFKLGICGCRTYRLAELLAALEPMVRHRLTSTYPYP